MQIDDADSLQEQDIDCVPVIACGRKQGRQWALYDLRTRTVQVFRSDDSRLLTLVARRNPLEREKLPKFMTWLDDSSLVLADAIASLWVFDLRLEEGIIDIVYRGRLACKGTFALQSNVRKPGSFWVGTNGGSMSYRLLRQGSETRLELSGTDCLHYGVVREVCRRV